MVANPKYDPIFPEDIPIFPEDVPGMLMTEEEFERMVNGESPYRYEWVKGVAYNMTGSSPEHSIISSNIDGLFREQLRRCRPCRAHREQYVAIPGMAPVVPDIVVTCDPADWDKDKRLQPFKIRSPLIVIEVLSPSTERYNRTEKFARYKRCPTLEVCIFVCQDEPFVEVYRRATDWKRECFSGDQVVRLDQLDLELPLGAIYEGVF